MISRLPELLYLDEKPVFADERRLVNAWARGGVEAERNEKKLMREEEQAAVERRLEEFRELTRRGREARGEGPSSQEDDTDSNPSSDEEEVWVPGSDTVDASESRDEHTSTSAAQSVSDASEAVPTHP